MEHANAALMNGPHTIRAASSLTALILAIACVRGESPSEHVVVIDTLVGGAIRVSNPQEGVWGGEPERRWRIVEDLRIGAVEGDDPYVFGGALSIVPISDGHIWVMDGQAHELRLFDGNGRWERTVGKEGNGPGEFIRNTCAFLGPNDEVWVEDSSRRWQRFDDKGSLVGSLRSTSTVGCDLRLWTQDARFFVVNTTVDLTTLQPSNSFLVVHHFGTDGELVPGDTVSAPVLPPTPILTLVGDRFRSLIIVPFTHRPDWVLGPSGDFWVTDGDGSYAIRRQSGAGDTLLMIRRTYDPVPVPDDLRTDAIEDVRRSEVTVVDGFDDDRVPRVYPPFDRFMIGTDGTLWVLRQSSDSEIGLDVFSRDGIYLGAAVVPAILPQISIRYVGTDNLYGVYRDDLGVSYVVRLTVQRPTT